MSTSVGKRVLWWWRTSVRCLGRPATVFAVALALRVGYVLISGDLYPLDAGDQMTYEQIAREWVQGRGFMPGSSYRPPGYPAFLGLVYWVFGPHRLAVELLQAVLGALAVLLTTKVAGAVFSRRVGILAGWIVALLPVLIHYCAQLMVETLFTTLLMLLLLVHVHHGDDRRKASVLQGLVTGAAALVRPNALLLPLAFALWRKIGCRWPMRKVLRETGICFAVAFCCILPWSLRNLRVQGAFVPISTNGGVNRWIGNNVYATGDWLKPGDYWSPAGQTEVEVDREYLRAAMGYIVAHPARALRLAVRKFGILWSPYPHVADRVSFWTVLALAVLGIGGTVRRKESWILLATLAYFTLVSCVFFATERFHVPLLPVVAVYAGAGVQWLATLVRKNRAEE